MEWYYWLIISYGILIFINTLYGVIKEWHKLKSAWIPLGILILFILGLIITPFMWLISWGWFTLFKTPSYKTFTIHELTEENKIALKELGFEEGQWVSNNNIDYKGFRYNGGNIAVQYNGRVFVKYQWLISKEQKQIMKQIKRLSKPINVEEKVEDLKKQIKDKKESQKRWTKWYQDDVDKLQKQIDELKQNEKENK